jgi:hypothetical protein
MREIWSRETISSIFWNKVIPPGRRASDIGLENGSEILHIHVLGIFNPEEMLR